MKNADKRNHVLAMLASGMTVGEIAEQEGVAEATARRWAQELGVKGASQLTQSVRAKAESMRAADAVEYLLNIVEGLAPTLCSQEELHEVDEHVPNLTPAQRRLLIYMVDRENALCTKDHLLTVVSMGSPDEPSIKVVDVQISKMRPKIPLSFGKITTAWGRGFIFQRPCELAFQYADAMIAAREDRP